MSQAVGGTFFLTEGRIGHGGNGHGKYHSRRHLRGIEPSYRQLDYLLVSRALAAANPDALPVIERRGMSRRAERADVKRFAGVGRNRPKASDHCPLVIDLAMG